jgi:hypothetical protein
MRLGVAVFAVAALVYMLTAPGHLQTEDMRSELAVAQSLVAHGDFTTSDTAPFGIRSVTGRDGRNYSKYGIGDSLLLVPAAAVGHLTHRCAHDDVPCRTDEQRATELVASFLDPLFAALSVTVMFFFAMALGARWAPALALSLLFGFATIEWAYAHDAFDVGPTGFFLLFGVFSVYKGGVGANSWRWLMVGGASIGFAVLIRSPILICLPVIAAYVVGRTWHQGRDNVLRSLVWFAAPIAAALAFTGWYNWVRFGDPLQNGYSLEAGAQPTFSANLAGGLAGLLFSPGKSIFVFSPPLLIAAAGAPAFFRRHRALALAIAGIVVANVLFYAAYYDWSGDWAWGPRYMVPIIGMAMLPAITVLERWRTLVSPARLGIVATAVAGAFVQLLAISVDFFQQLERLRNQNIEVESTYWDVPHTAIVQHTLTVWRTVNGTSHLDFLGLPSEFLTHVTQPVPDIWWIVLRRGGTSPLSIGAVIVVAIVAAMTLVARARLPGSPSPASPSPQLPRPVRGR